MLVKIKLSFRKKAKKQINKKLEGNRKEKNTAYNNIQICDDPQDFVFYGKKKTFMKIDCRLDKMVKKLLLVPLAIVLNLALLYIIVQFAPDTYGENNLSFPSSLDDIRKLAIILNNYNTNHPHYVLLLFSLAYVFKQTFAVPGSVFLNVLAGAIFGSGAGFLLCCCLTACGASLCYLLARAVGKDVAMKYFPERVQIFGTKLEENKQELPYFLLFLRLFPMSPNWALNMASGVLGDIEWIHHDISFSHF